MPKQKITYPDTGSRPQRVLEALTPMTGTAAPAVHAEFVGQIFVDTTAKNVYVSVATDSVDAADDWVEVTPTT